MYEAKYSISNQILTNIGLIEGAKEVIENAPLVPFYEKQFQSDATLRIIHHGTSIEGNDLSLDQTKRVLDGESVVGTQRDVQEVINYRNVMELVDEISTKRGEYKLDDLLDLQRETVTKIVPEEKIGLRKTQVVIKEGGSGKVVLRPPEHTKVQGLVSEFLDWLNTDASKSIHPILRAGIAHYVLVSIHPFIDGNGRTIRAFTTMLLLKEHYDIKRFFALEEHFDKNLAEYYEAFAQVDKQSGEIADRDLTAWLEYFTGVVAVELTKIKERVRKISIDSRLKSKIGSQVALTERQMRLVEYISTNSSAVMGELKQILPMVSEDTILRDLAALLEKKIIQKEGHTKGSVYTMRS